MIFEYFWHFSMRDLPKTEIFIFSCVFGLFGTQTTTFSGCKTDCAISWQYERAYLASPHAFQNNPRLVWEFYSWRREMVRSVEPNSGHFALAELEQILSKTGKRLDIVTQNVDDLHRRAGSKNITKLQTPITQHF